MWLFSHFRSEDPVVSITWLNAPMANYKQSCRRNYGVDFSLACIDLSRNFKIFKYSYHRLSFIVYLFEHYLNFRWVYVIKTIFYSGKMSLKLFSRNWVRVRVSTGKLQTEMNCGIQWRHLKGVDSLTKFEWILMLWIFV